MNSWWDFGHHFKFISDRAVTFDGGTQNSPQAHWIGRVLQTDNEEEAIAILRMLDCGANSAFKLALEETNDPLISVSLVKDIIMHHSREEHYRCCCRNSHGECEDFAGFLGASQE